MLQNRQARTVAFRSVHTLINKTKSIQEDMMKERDNINFLIHLLWQRLPVSWKGVVRNMSRVHLKRGSPEKNQVVSCNNNESGSYKAKLNWLFKLLFGSGKIAGLPPYCEVLIEHRTGKVCTTYARWVLEDPTAELMNISKAEFEKLFDRSVAVFSKAAADNADLSPFASHGGKLIIDHGLDDPLIPVDGTIDYYERMKVIMGDEGFMV